VPYRTIETVTEEGHSWILLNGDHHRRMQTVIEITDLILLRRSGFTSPPWPRAPSYGLRPHHDPD
jgi:hypothetical protein